MDDRQQHIEVGGGLQDERINQDFKDCLEKYTLPILAVLLVVVGLYSGSKWYGTIKEQRIDDAFVALEAARGTLGSDGLYLGSPDNLLDVAKQYSGRGSASTLAMLDAADIYLGAVRRGIAPGANLADVQPDELLDDERSEELLTKADELYKKVIDRTRHSQAKSVLYQRALLGAASVAMTRHDTVTAHTLLTTLAEHTEKLGYTSQAVEARARLAALDSYANPVALLTEQEVDPIENDPFIERVDDNTLRVIRQPEGFVPPGFDPSMLPGSGDKPKQPPADGSDTPQPPAQDQSTKPDPNTPAEPDPNAPSTPNGGGN